MWKELTQPIEGLLSEVFACRFQFFAGNANDKNPYLQFVVFSDTNQQAQPNAYMLSRKWWLPKKIDFDFSEVKKHQWLTMESGEKRLVSTTFTVSNGKEVAKSFDCTRYTGRVRLLPKIWENDYDLRLELRDSQAVGEHFPSGIEKV